MVVLSRQILTFGPPIFGKFCDVLLKEQDFTAVTVLSAGCNLDSEFLRSPHILL